MSRIRILLTALVATLVCALSAAAASPTPRGVLTKLEYQELHATDAAMKRAGKAHGTPTQVARHTCRALTNATRLTAAERAECQASLIFSYRFFAFPYEVQHCEKGSTRLSVIHCVLGAVSGFERATTVFIRTDAASARAARPRHFPRHCLDYLLFTRQQATTTGALAVGLRRYARAIRSGNAAAVTSAGSRLDGDIVNSRQAMSLSISVSACPHR